MAKILITHINPHLDDIAAIWLFKKFHSGWDKAKIEFISQSETFQHQGKESADRIYFGIGMGKYDEHKGDKENCAASLVWKEIKKENLAPKDELEIKAYDELVHWIFLVDTAKLSYDQWSQYRFDSFIRSYEDSPKDSLATVKLGEEILERILPNLVRQQRGLKQWKNRIEFKSKWGKSVAVGGADFSRSYAYLLGYQLVIQYGPEDHFLGITAPGTSDHDLTAIYLNLTKKEPEASWFLHHSHRMVLCGSKSAPDGKRSKLTLQEVVDLVKSIE